MQKAKILYRSCMNESEWRRAGGEALGPTALQHSMDSCQRGCAPTRPLGQGSPGDTALLPAACDPIYILTPAWGHPVQAGGKW